MNIKLYPAILIVLALSSWVVFNEGFTISLSEPANSIPCQKPLTYHIGNIDSRFNISERELKSVLEEVETLWSTALNREVVNFSVNGEVAVHLIYSKEQKKTDAERQFSDRISIKEDEEKVARRQYKRLAQQYKNSEQDLKQTLEKYNSTSKNYNELAKKWNGKEVTQEVISKFKSLEKQLEKLDAKLTRKQDRLKYLQQKTNAKAEKLNETINEYNDLINKYNDRFSEPRRFDQGRYIRKGSEKEINIYQFRNRAQLKTVLAHEVGHALGLKHVSNPESIMHKMMDEQNMADLTLTDEDRTALKSRCGK